MIENKFTIEQFLEDIEEHQLIIEQDSGVYRHIRLGRIGDTTYQFYLTTWPGHLCISGDMGTHVFRRTQDMFTFFRCDELKVNHGYWHEKLCSVSKFGSDREFSAEKFKEYVKEAFEEAKCDNDWDEETAKNRWEELEYDVLNRDCEEDEREAMTNAHNFESEDWNLEDFWEHDCRCYTYHFTWILHAIVWGIQQYDEARKAMEQPATR